MNNSNYLNLDILRSLAVLCVVAQHLWHQCVNVHLCAYSSTLNDMLSNLSFTGVMFFFVHTCLVLMLSMGRSPDTHIAGAFLVRRAFRIYPLAWATILLALMTGLTDHPEASWHILGWRGVASNFLLVQNMTRSFPSVVGPLWSLPWEVQMYLVLPLFFVVLRKFDRLFVVFALWAGAVLVAVLATQTGAPRAFHAVVFPPMFIGGMVAYRLLARAAGKRRFSLPFWAWPPFVCGLFALQAWLMRGRSFERPAGAVINSSVCLLLALSIPAFDQMRLRWLAWPAQQIAKYSYGIYLLHVPVLIFVMFHLPRMSMAATVAVSLSLITLVSVGCFHLIEDPLIRIGKRWAASIQAPTCQQGIAAARPALLFPATRPY